MELFITVAGFVIAFFFVLLIIVNLWKNLKVSKRALAQFEKNDRNTAKQNEYYEKYDKDVAKRDQQVTETNDLLKSILAELKKLNAEKS